MARIEINMVARNRVCAPKYIRINIPSISATILPAVPGAFGLKPLYPKVIKNQFIGNPKLKMLFDKVSSGLDKNLFQCVLLKVHL